MSKMEQWTWKWKDFRGKAQPGLEKAGQVCHKTGDVLGTIGTWVWHLRKIFFSIPVVVLSVYLARLNSNVLPEMVGINLQNSGEYAMMISKDLAVYGPLGVTAACLLMMFLSRKTLYPWIISMFSLALPVLILITNVFPA